jgi:hypothetical protein
MYADLILQDMKSFNVSNTFQVKSPEHDLIRKREKNPVLVAIFVA